MSPGYYASREIVVRFARNELNVLRFARDELTDFLVRKRAVRDRPEYKQPAVTVPLTIIACLLRGGQEDRNIGASGSLVCGRSPSTVFGMQLRPRLLDECLCSTVGGRCDVALPAHLPALADRCYLCLAAAVGDIGLSVTCGVTCASFAGILWGELEGQVATWRAALRGGFLTNVR